MKTFFCLVLLAGSLAAAVATTSINSTNHYAYGANIGWMDWRGDVTNGAVIGEYVCSGYIYAANVGWIGLGGGSPPGGIYYSNTSASDWGVNHDGSGNLRGYAYGANIGWVNFENTGAPKVDLLTGKFGGYIYSANCGWISLSNAFAHVQTDTIVAGADSNTNGLADAWELQNFGYIGVDPNADPDNDGMSNLQEYRAGTDPNNGSDYLKFTAYSAAPGGIQSTATWSSVSTRLYYVEKTDGLGTNAWTDSGLGIITPDGATTTRNFSDTNIPARFYRVRAVKPLP
jgi:hypothetical protein